MANRSLQAQFHGTTLTAAQIVWEVTQDVLETDHILGQPLNEMPRPVREALNRAVRASGAMLRIRSEFRQQHS